MGSIAQNGQLALNFDLSVRREAPSKSKESFVYHPSDSTIMKDSFSIKVAFGGRSYILKGKYKISTIRAFGDMEDKTNMLGFVDLEKILAYKGFLYSPAFVGKQEKQRIIRVLEKILSNPKFNENLSF